MNIGKMRVVSILILGLLGGVSGGSSVPIRDIESLIFHKGELTTGRRVSPVQQLICTTKRSGPDSIMCKNIGWDGTDVIWKCEASLDEGFEIEETHIICEGYDYPEDPNILSGSCSLSYSLIDTNEPSGGYFVMFLAIFIWIIIIVFICGPSPSPYYRRRNDGPGFWTGAGLGYWAGSTRVPSSSFGYPKSGGRHPSVSYAKPGRR